MNVENKVYPNLTIDSSEHPFFLVNGKKYDLFCEYDERARKADEAPRENTIKILMECEGNGLIVDFGDGRALYDYFSLENNKLDALFNFIEATVSLKSGIEIYAVVLKDYLSQVDSDKKKYPIIWNEIEGKSSVVSRLVNQIHQNKAIKEWHSLPSVLEHIVMVDYTVPGLINDPASKPIEFNFVFKPAANLPVGWLWKEYIDGSGHLESPIGVSFYSYDLQPYSLSGGIEYQNLPNTDFEVFKGSFKEFKAYAEAIIGKELCCIGKYNIPEMMNQLSSNAWNGRDPKTICLTAGDNIIKMDGYIIEPHYEDFSSASSISFNGQILYGVDSRSVSAYRHEVYTTGIYDCLDKAVAHIKECIKGQNIVLVEEQAQVDKLISRAEVLAAQRQADSKTLQLNGVEKSFE